MSWLKHLSDLLNGGLNTTPLAQNIARAVVPSQQLQHVTAVPVQAQPITQNVAQPSVPMSRALYDTQSSSAYSVPHITYNPNSNVNIPYSAHTMQDATLGNEYTRNPQAKKFIGVDPERFGYPADNASKKSLNTDLFNIFNK